MHLEGFQDVLFIITYTKSTLSPRRGILFRPRTRVKLKGKRKNKKETKPAETMTTYEAQILKRANIPVASKMCISMRRRAPTPRITFRYQLTLDGFKEFLVFVGVFRRRKSHPGCLFGWVDYIALNVLTRHVVCANVV